jgi:hypothetical protein
MQNEYFIKTENIHLFIMDKVKLYSGSYTYTYNGIASKYMPELVQIYDATKNKKHMIKKTFVFDLDVTIGSFGDMYYLWTCLHIDHRIQSIFNDLLDMFPEFLRVGILPIFEYIKKKYEKRECRQIYLYTNNQCEYPNWVKHLISYLNSKLSVEDTASIFAKPVCAFKIKDRRIELFRNGHSKTYDDFIRCSMLPKSVEICFVDDVVYDKMIDSRIYFIQPPPYFHRLSRDTIIDRFMTSDLYRRLYPSKPHFKSAIEYEYIVDPHDIEVSKKMMYYIREFFFVSLKPEYTRKRRARIGRFSRKLHRK